MSDWQPRPDAELDVTLEQLARMHRALGELNRERARYGDAWFAVMAEGPLDEIARLETELARLTGRAEIDAAAADARAELWMRIAGKDLHWPNARTSVLTSLLDTLRKGVQVVAEWCATREVSKRPTNSLKDACDFEIVALAPGSVRVGVQLPELPSQQQLPLESGRDAAREALELYLSVASWAADPGGTSSTLDDRVADPVLRRLLLAQVKRLLPRPRGRVDLVELSGRAVPGHATVHLDRGAHDRIDAMLVAEPDAMVETLEGDLREIDLDNRTFVLRNLRDQHGSMQVACAYSADLDESAYEAIDRRVEVVAERKIEARRGTLPLKVVRLSILDADGE
jgi:hypothetical protein